MYQKSYDQNLNSEWKVGEEKLGKNFGKNIFGRRQRLKPRAKKGCTSHLFVKGC